MTVLIKQPLNSPRSAKNHTIILVLQELFVLVRSLYCLTFQNPGGGEGSGVSLKHGEVVLNNFVLYIILMLLLLLLVLLLLLLLLLLMLLVLRIVNHIPKLCQSRKLSTPSRHPPSP